MTSMTVMTTTREMPTGENATTIVNVMPTTEPSSWPGAVTVETYYYDADGGRTDDPDRAVARIRRHLSADGDLVGEEFARATPPEEAEAKE